MPSVFKTQKDNPDSTTIGGVPGVIGSEGRGGIPLAVAAESMAELQDAEGKPLTGQKLKDAAEAWAKERDIVVTNASDKDIERFPAELNRAPDRPPANEVADEAYADAYGQVPEIRDGAIVSESEAVTVESPDAAPEQNTPAGEKEA